MSLHNDIRNTFVEFYNKHKSPVKYYWTGKDAGNTRELIKRIRSQSKHPLTDEQVLKQFKRLLWTVPDKGWYWQNLNMWLFLNKWQELNEMLAENDRGQVVKKEEIKPVEIRGGKLTELNKLLEEFGK